MPAWVGRNASRKSGEERAQPVFRSDYADWSASGQVYKVAKENGWRINMELQDLLRYIDYIWFSKRDTN